MIKSFYLFFNDNISVNIIETKTDVFIAIVLRCFRGNLYNSLLMKPFLFKKNIEKYF